MQKESTTLQARRASLPENVFEPPESPLSTVQQLVYTRADVIARDFDSLLSDASYHLPTAWGP
eukprot:6982513-Alexandrium_andersonii.AAC.1